MLPFRHVFINSYFSILRKLSTMTRDPFHVELLSERAQKGLKYPSTGPQNLAHSNNPFHPENNTEVGFHYKQILFTL
jgi:hypothetical protein